MVQRGEGTSSTFALSPPFPSIQGTKNASFYFLGAYSFSSSLLPLFLSAICQCVPSFSFFSRTEGVSSLSGMEAGTRRGGRGSRPPGYCSLTQSRNMWTTGQDGGGRGDRRGACQTSSVPRPLSDGARSAPRWKEKIVGLRRDVPEKGEKGELCKHEEGWDLVFAMRVEQLIHT